MILIVGAGFLGSYIIKETKKITDEPIAATIRKKENAIFEGVDYYICDVAEKEDILSLAEKLKGKRLRIIYLAACHNIDYVFENPLEGEKINLAALENFMSAFEGRFEKFIFASTDCVYGENKDKNHRFKECDELHPVNEYGRQKAYAERIVKKKGGTTVRLPYILGASLGEKKHFYDVLYEKLQKGESIEMVDGLVRSVLGYAQAARLILALLDEERLPDCINIASDRAFTKYEMGVALTEKWGFASGNIIRISEDEGRKFFKDKRAASAVMDNSLLKKITGIKEINWEV